jgi:hypothetical protein
MKELINIQIYSPKKCTPFKPCLQQNTGIFSEFDKTGVNYPIF